MAREIGTISNYESISHAADFISEEEIGMAQLMSFAHDGLRDSLTHLAAPPYFYENLRRELVTAERNRSRLTLIRFQLVADLPSSEPNNSALTTSASGQEISHSSSESLYELAILSFAEFLKSVTRAEDFCARLGHLEFTLILRAAQEVGETLVARVLSGWQMDSFFCTSALVTARPGESSLEILNRLDNQELQG
jgi:GGDEF domain-containing protein